MNKYISILNSHAIEIIKGRVVGNEKVDSKFEFEIYDLARVMNASSHLLLLVTYRIFPRVFHSVFCTHPPYIKHKQRFHLHNN